MGEGGRRRWRPAGPAALLGERPAGRAAPGLSAHPAAPLLRRRPGHFRAPPVPACPAAVYRPSLLAGWRGTPARRPSACCHPPLRAACSERPLPRRAALPTPVHRLVAAPQAPAARRRRRRPAPTPPLVSSAAVEAFPVQLPRPLPETHTAAGPQVWHRPLAPSARAASELALLPPPPSWLPRCHPASCHPPARSPLAPPAAHTPAAATPRAALASASALCLRPFSLPAAAGLPSLNCSLAALSAPRAPLKPSALSAPSCWPCCAGRHRPQPDTPAATAAHSASRAALPQCGNKLLQCKEEASASGSAERKPHPHLRHLLLQLIGLHAPLLHDLLARGEHGVTAHTDGRRRELRASGAGRLGWAGAPQGACCWGPKAASAAPDGCSRRCQLPPARFRQPGGSQIGPGSWPVLLPAGPRPSCCHMQGTACGRPTPGRLLR